MKITLIAGARPNFMKIAPIIWAINSFNEKNVRKITFRLVHTGQHYDDKLSRIFFQELKLPEPDINLGAGSGTQAEQTARIMIEFEKDLMKNPSDLVVVVGDVTSTMACTIVAKKLNTKVAHVEGGIRSFDMAMPEEINRMVTDSLSDFFFTTSEVANENLKRTGISPERIFFVGNVMIDSLQYCLTSLRKPAIWDELELIDKEYFVLTLHRPSNVDDPLKLAKFLKEIAAGASSHPVVFPVHPRTRKNLPGSKKDIESIHAVDPQSYFDFIYLLRHSRGVITDSGGIQEETTVMGIPCVTLRSNTERPETVSIGTNELVGEDFLKLKESFKAINEGKWKQGKIPPLWDGKAAGRIIEVIARSIHS